MAKMKYWNGSAWVVLDAKDADTLDGKHASNFADAAQFKNHIDNHPKGFSGNYNDLTNKPTSMPANGGNADTIDGKHASDFADADLLNRVNELADTKFDKVISHSERSLNDVYPFGVHRIFHPTDGRPDTYTEESDFILVNYSITRKEDEPWSRQMLFDVRSNRVFFRQLSVEGPLETGTPNNWKEMALQGDDLVVKNGYPTITFEHTGNKTKNRLISDNSAFWFEGWVDGKVKSRFRFDNNTGDIYHDGNPQTPFLHRYSPAIFKAPSGEVSGTMLMVAKHPDNDEINGDYLRIDTMQDRIRIFESTSPYRGISIPLGQCDGVDYTMVALQKDTVRYLGVLEQVDLNNHFNVNVEFYMQGGINYPSMYPFETSPFGYVKVNKGYDGWTKQEFTHCETGYKFQRVLSSSGWCPWYSISGIPVDVPPYAGWKLVAGCQSVMSISGDLVTYTAVLQPDGLTTKAVKLPPPRNGLWVGASAVGSKGSNPFIALQPNGELDFQFGCLTDQYYSITVAYTMHHY